MSLYDDASLIAYPSGYKESKIYTQKPVPSYGAELVTNGDFATDTDWNKGSGSTISGGNLNIISAPYNATTRQTISLTSGVTYRILINATAVGSATANTFQLGFGDSSGNPSSTTQYEFAVGSSTKTLTVTASATDTTILFRSRDAGTSNLAIHSVSVKEVLVATADLTFSRASSATRVNAEGLIETAAIIGSEQVTVFTNGTTYPFDTFITSDNNITSAIVSSAFAGTASNAISVTSGEIL